MFIKYRSLENHYRVVKDFLPLDMLVAVTEKLDGSNFSLITSGGIARYASRNQLVDGSWNNLQGLVPAQLIDKLTKLSDEVGRINLFGEVFSSKILKRIPYGEARVRFFDAIVDGEYLSANEFDELMIKLGYTDLCVKYTVMTLKKALEIDVEGLKTAFAEDSMAEGIVIKSLRHNQINHRIPVIKKKSGQFLEKSKVGKKSMELNEEQQKFGEYINEARVLSYISKEGPMKEMNQMGDYIKGVLADAWVEFFADLTDEHRMLIDQRVTMRPYARKVAGILKEQVA